METCLQGEKFDRLKKARDEGCNHPSDMRMRTQTRDLYQTISIFDHPKRLQQTCNAPLHSCIGNKIYVLAHREYHSHGQAQCPYHRVTLSAIHHYLESAAQAKAKKTLHTHTPAAETPA